MEAIDAALIAVGIVWSGLLAALAVHALHLRGYDWRPRRWRRSMPGEKHPEQHVPDDGRGAYDRNPNIAVYQFRADVMREMCEDEGLKYKEVHMPGVERVVAVIPVRKRKRKADAEGAA